MPTIPQCTHHKASGQAVVRLGHKDHYLGRWGSKIAQVEYDRLVAEWLAAGRRAPEGLPDGLLVVQLIARFWDHAEAYYRGADGKPTGEIPAFRESLKPLRRLYGHTPAASFGPLALKAVRQAMIDADLCRNVINLRIGRVRRVFKWGVENELVPPSVLHGLQAVSGLKAGRCGVRESVPVRPVAEDRVYAVREFLSRPVWAMVQLQLLTGMRPGEVVGLRGIDLDMSGRLWMYRPAKHKTQYLGHERIVFFGPKAQAILKPLLKVDLQAYLFSPEDADAERRAALSLRRSTPLSCGNVPGSHVQRKPRKKPGKCYTVTAYARAIKYACTRAFPLPDHLQPKILDSGKRESQRAWKARLTPGEKAEIQAYHRANSWHPNQLRHSAATNLRKQFGLEPAQVILGHKTLTVTQIYAEKNVEAAMKVMAEVG